MATNAGWPPADRRSVLGERVDRLDGMVKATGKARFAYDINRPNMLYAKVVGAKPAKAAVTAVDTSAAEAVDGVVEVWVSPDVPGLSVNYSGQIIAAVAAETEEAADEGARAIAIEYDYDTPQMNDRDPDLAEGEAETDARGDVDTAFVEADAVMEGDYECECITHCCLEPHGQVAEFRDGELYIWATTQNVSRYGQGLTNVAELPQDKIHVDCQYMGGGFGSKFGHDKWGEICVRLAKSTGRPVKLMLDRDLEQQIAGHRNSAFAHVRIALRGDGEILGFDAENWGSGGAGGYSNPHLPYGMVGLPNVRVRTKNIPTNRGAVRAWRAPRHPEGCFITMSAMEDAAAALGMDAKEFFLNHVIPHTQHEDVYREEIEIAAEMIGYEAKKHPRGDATDGPLKRGLGMSIHQWGGMGHPSESDVTINSDGSVEIAIGTQDLGTGSRTVIGTVVAETLGLPVDRISVKIGNSKYPMSGASGGSTTAGGISASSRLGAHAALQKLFETAAPELGVAPDALEAWDGEIRERGNAGNAMSWDEACGLLGVNSIKERGVCSPPQAAQQGLINRGAAGVQMADVTVDIETGVVRINEFAGVQDCGLIVSMKTAESQVYGGMIMGVAYALFEEAIYDYHNGRMLNADMEFYKLATMGDCGELKVHMMTGPGYDEKGVIGLGEPPVISPGAAISNAVANACGVRVKGLPITPRRVIEALEEGGVLT